MAMLPTGGGKTPLFSKILRDNSALGVAVAHRRELVTQMSTTLARYEVRHSIIGGIDTVKTAVGFHMDETGRSYYAPNSSVICAGIDSLNNQDDAAWMHRVSLWVGDEGHHFLRSNKWGRGVARFPNARGLLVTATPGRADGKGLGSHADGLADVLVQGPGMRDLIEMGYLTDYKIYCPPSDIDLTKVNVSAATGDFNYDQLRAAVHKSHIVGDVVDHYQRLANGTQAIVFAVDVESATDIAKRFNQFSIAAEVVTAKTPDAMRASILKRFKARQIQVLVNVDLFGEGFDVPSVETVIMARPTESNTLYSQQFGRGLRPFYVPGWPLDTVAQRLAAIAASNKPRALIIDHVNNVIRHNGPPDALRIWSLNGTSRSARRSGTPYRICPECTAPYISFSKHCPFCGHYPEPLDRSSPMAVKGDLTELDPHVLAALRGDAERLMGAPQVPHFLEGAPAAGYQQKHWATQRQQQGLRDAIQWYAGYYLACGRDDSETYRRFFHEFGIDVATAQTLRQKDAAELEGKVRQKLAELGIDGRSNNG